MKTAPFEAPPEASPQPRPPRLGVSRLVVVCSISVSLLVLLLVVTELGSTALLSLIQGTQGVSAHQHLRPNPHQSYFRNKPWAVEFWKETSLASPKAFSPFVMWRRNPFHGKYVNVEPDGLRRTVNPSCTPEARQIWIFGSSTLWGTGARDDETIPSYFSSEYAKAIGPVCVTNFGEAGWVNTQSVIQLELALKRAQRPPDLVLFDDGYSDVFVTYESGRADVHMDYETIKGILEGGLAKHSTFGYLKETATYRFLSAMMDYVSQLRSAAQPKGSPATTVRPARNLDNLAEMTVENYRENLKLVDSLAAGYGFRYTAFWGPAIFVGKKPLSSPERNIVEMAADGSPQLAELSRKTYALMFAKPVAHIIDISDVFDGTGEDIFLDVSHANPDGNRLIALRMLAALKSSGGLPTAVR